MFPEHSMDFNGDVLVFSVNQQYDLEYYKTKAAHTRASKTAAATQQHQIATTDVPESTSPAAAESKGIQTVLKGPLAEVEETKLTIASTTMTESVPVISNTSNPTTAMNETQQSKVTETVATEPASIIEATNASAEQTATFAVTAAETSSTIVTSQPSTAALQPIVTTSADVISTVTTMSNVPAISPMIEDVDKRDGIREESGVLMDVMGIIDEMVLDVIAAAETSTTVTAIAPISTAVTTTPLPQLENDVSSNPNVISTLKEANSGNEQQQITPILPSTTSTLPLETNTGDVHGDGNGNTKGDDDTSANKQDEIKKKKMDALKTESLWLEKSLRERIQVRIFDHSTLPNDTLCFIIHYFVLLPSVVPSNSTFLLFCCVFHLCSQQILQLIKAKQGD